jgi:para-nitrobenzyl esterase
MAEGPMSEDCLALNIWTPRGDPAAKRPVMVWLHPGGFSGGAGYQYTGDGNLARKGDIVQVEVNHRLNVFGYLQLAGLDEGYADSGNVGMLDLVLALEWVRDNIEAFGGDPDNVTIFGESGGGAKVSTLMAMPAAQGLFHKAIAQSGFALRMVEPDAATANAERLLAELGLAPDRVGELQDVPTERLLGAFQAIRSGPGRGFAPVVDGRALPRHPWTPDAPPGSADVPLMLGCTRDETTILLGMLGPDPDAMFQLEEGDMRRRLAERLETDEATTASIVETYRAALSPAPPAPPASPSDVYFRATSDHMMRVPSILQAERKAVQPGAPAWLYLFTWESPFMSGRMKAHHGAELPFVFDTIEANADRIGGAGPDRRALADQMLAAWSRFAHTGDPNHPGLPAWQPYSLTERDTMLFDMPSQLASDPYGSTREAMTLIVAVR